MNGLSFNIGHMIVLLSPAKSLNMDKQKVSEFTHPELQDHSHTLINILKRKSVKSIKELMRVSDNIAKLNYDRYKSYDPDHHSENSKQALFTFDGDVYRGLEASSLNKREIAFAQKHVRILSGLYGILKPLDLIQPYRLEMGSRLKNRRGKHLYDFWGDRITDIINRDLALNKSDLVINLASNEYFKSVQKKKLHGDLLNINFKEYRNDKYVFVSFSAKRARGMMCRYIIKNKVKRIKDTQGFDYDGYSFNADLSSDREFIFTK